MRIVFLGTPDFAVPSLNALNASKHNICAVFTRPDKPSGRNRRMAPQPVKTAALAIGLDVFQPPKVLVEHIAPFSPDLVVVVAFHQILPKPFLDVPRNGCVNVHASLLPRYRGASPVNQAILNGDPFSGVTTMKLDEGMDTGDTYLQKKVEIREKETAASLHDRLAAEGAKLLVRTVDMIENGTAAPVPQDHSMASYAPKLAKEDGKIDWFRTAKEIDRQVRGLFPWPGAFTVMGGRTVKIISGYPSEDSYSGVAGEIIRLIGDSIGIACGERSVYVIESIQPEGKKAMSGGDFMRGGYGNPGMRFNLDF